jgi:hypothetical protein
MCVCRSKLSARPPAWETPRGRKRHKDTGVYIDEPRQDKQGNICTYTWRKALRCGLLSGEGGRKRERAPPPGYGPGLPNAAKGRHVKRKKMAKDGNVIICRWQCM